MPFQPHEYWQEIHQAATTDPMAGLADGEPFPAALPGGWIALPVRPLPGPGDRAVASLIVNQASFAVVDALVAAMAGHARAFGADLVVGVPTLGLPLAEGVARRLGHNRFVALGTSRKFWYEDELSVPMASVTSPGPGKRLYLDPRMLPVLAGSRLLIVDDVVSTGASLLAVLALLARAGFAPTAAVFAMLQGAKWRTALAMAGHGDLKVAGALETPRLRRGTYGLWRPDPADDSGQ